MKPIKYLVLSYLIQAAYMRTQHNMTYEMKMMMRIYCILHYIFLHLFSFFFRMLFILFLFSCEKQNIIKIYVFGIVYFQNLNYFICTGWYINSIHTLEWNMLVMYRKVHLQQMMMKKKQHMVKYVWNSICNRYVNGKIDRKHML